MNLLIDTHILLWWLADDAALPSEVRTALGDPDNLVFVSTASVWEIAIKKQLGKIVLPDDYTRELEEEGFRELPILFRHIEELEGLPLLHRDPFDRLLIAQAKSEKLAFVTTDSQIRKYSLDLFPRD